MPEPAYTLHETVDELREEWDALAVRTGNIFATPDFASLWWRHFGGGRRRLLLTSVRRDDGSLAAVLPLYRWRRVPPLGRCLGHHAGDQLGPVCAPGDRPLAAAALGRLAREQRLAAVLLEQAPAAEGWPALLGGAALARESSPYVPLPETWEAYLASRSKNFRDQARGRERRLGREHQVAFRLADAETLEADLDTLFRLHRARWRRRTTFGDREAFHRDFARAALGRGWLRLWTLELDGRAVASWQGFRFGASESYYQGGRDPAHERASVGFVLMVHTIREAIATGAAEYRLLRGGEEYKQRFAAADAEVETIVAGAGHAGAAAVVAARALRDARRLRRRLHERGNMTQKE